VIATIAVGRYPVDVATDPTGHRLFVLNEGAGTVSVIDESGAAGGRVTGTVDVGFGVIGIGVDPRQAGSTP